MRDSCLCLLTIFFFFTRGNVNNVSHCLFSVRIICPPARDGGPPLFVPGETKENGLGGGGREK